MTLRRVAAESGLPIAIVNLGVTRADGLAALKLDADCEAALTSFIPNRRIKP